MSKEGQASVMKGGREMLPHSPGKWCSVDAAREGGKITSNAYEWQQ